MVADADRWQPVPAQRSLGASALSDEEAWEGLGASTVSMCSRASLSFWPTVQHSPNTSWTALAWQRLLTVFQNGKTPAPTQGGSAVRGCTYYKVQ